MGKLVCVGGSDQEFEIPWRFWLEDADGICGGSPSLNDASRHRCVLFCRYLDVAVASHFRGQSLEQRVEEVGQLQVEHDSSQSLDA